MPARCHSPLLLAVPLCNLLFALNNKRAMSSKNWKGACSTSAQDQGRGRLAAPQPQQNCWQRGENKKSSRLLASLIAKMTIVKGQVQKRSACSWLLAHAGEPSGNKIRCLRPASARARVRRDEQRVFRFLYNALVMPVYILLRLRIRLSIANVCERRALLLNSIHTGGWCITIYIFRTASVSPYVKWQTQGLTSSALFDLWDSLLQVALRPPKLQHQWNLLFACKIF